MFGVDGREWNDEVIGFKSGCSMLGDEEWKDAEHSLSHHSYRAWETSLINWFQGPRALGSYKGLKVQSWSNIPNCCNK